MAGKMSKEKKTERKSPKQTKIYQKDIYIKLTGSSKEDLQDVANKLHSLDHPLIVGGESSRTVHMTHTSTKPTLVFAGKVK